MLSKEQVEELCEDSIADMTSNHFKEVLAQAKLQGKEKLSRSYKMTQEEFDAISTDTYGVAKKYLPILVGMSYDPAKGLATFTLYPQGYAPLY